MKKNVNSWFGFFGVLCLISIMSISCKRGHNVNNETKDNKATELFCHYCCPIPDSLFGKVKSLREYSFMANEKYREIIERDSKSYYRHNDYFKKYNEKGKLVELIHFDSNEKQVYKTTYLYDVRDNLIESRKVQADGRVYVTSWSFIYDNKGNVIEESYPISDVNSCCKLTNKYDNKGNNVESRYSYIDGHFSVLSTKYDNEGNLIEREFYDSNEMGYKTIDKYYRGKKVEETRITPEGIIVEQWTNKYDDKGNEIENSYLKSDGTVETRKLSFKYDKNDNLISGVHYKPDGSLFERLTFKYDKRGNRIQQKTYKSDGSLEAIWTYKYDVSNNVIEDNYYPKGILGSKTTYKFYNKIKKTEIIYYDTIGKFSGRIQIINDTKGNEIERSEFDSKDNCYDQSISKYTYDKQGNWIKVIKFKDQKLIHIDERTIEYYD